MTNMLLIGAAGKMGRTIAEIAAQTPDLTITAGVEPFAGDASFTFPIYASFDDIEPGYHADVIVDFSNAASTEALLAYAKRTLTPVVVATTGQSPQQLETLKQAGDTVAVFKAGNMSLGISLMLKLAQESSSFFADRAEMEIIETHHRYKVDSPSGTALMLFDAVNSARTDALKPIYGRHGVSQARTKREIGIHAIRGGTVTGEHTLRFFCEDETLEIKHMSSSRRIYAVGALEAARFLIGRSARLYNMQDLLLEKASVTNLYIDRDAAMLTVHGLPFGGRHTAQVLRLLAQADIIIDMISQTAAYAGKVDLSFTLPKAKLDMAIELLRGAALITDADADVVKLTIVGPGMSQQSGVAAKVFELLSEQDIDAHIITTAETQIELCLQAADERTAVSALSEAFQL